MRPDPHTPKRLEIGVLYGFRALMVLFVANFHLWQQSWVPQYITLFGHVISLDFWTRSSYVFVDGMILLSGFLLYLPFARQPLEGTPVPRTGEFYFRRAARILPSYLFAVLAALVLIAVPQGLYGNAGRMAHDVAAHLTFTFLFWPETYIATPLNVSLWTIAVEMQFYLIFPLLARWMQKRPALTAGGMMLAGWAYRLWAACCGMDTSMLLNQLPAFLDVYALGFLGAMAYVRIRLKMQQADRNMCLAAGGLTAGLFALGLVVLTELLKVQSASGAQGYEMLRLSQMAIRLPLAVTLLVMMLSAAFWPKLLQKLLDNRLTRFLSVISFNLYIWHQVLAVEMRKAWFSDFEKLHADPKLQWAYMTLSAAVAVLAAMVMTYGLEQPAARWADRLRRACQKQKKTPVH